MKINQIINESIDPKATAKQVLGHLLKHRPDVFSQYGDEFVVGKVKQAVQQHLGDIEGAVDHALRLLSNSDDVTEDAAFDPAAAEKQMDAGAEKQAADDPDPGSKSLADKAALDAPVAAMGQID